MRSLRMRDLQRLEEERHISLAICGGEVGASSGGCNGRMGVGLTLRSEAPRSALGRGRHL